MRASVIWHPALPSPALPSAGTVHAIRVAGQALALWRSATGQVQAWEDRCPHRGVALSLGRVLGDRLACAYHGWEYAEGSGRCVAIPAMPHQPVPGKVCVKTYAAVERQGMVWVRLDGEATASPADDSPGEAPLRFLRSIAVAAPRSTIDTGLAAQGFSPAGPCQWRGQKAGHVLRLWVLDAATDWCLLHVASEATPSDANTGELFNALRILRDRLAHPRS
ncbi:Rieske (2Fe-2S) protein [Comamonadaceae bacterium G21597-S1]|nr:Rieske (2Fe-2S) protein [Comamonadaceae bacterium G21597-S1]